MTSASLDRQGTQPLQLPVPLLLQPPACSIHGLLQPTDRLACPDQTWAAVLVGVCPSSLLGTGSASSLLGAVVASSLLGAVSASSLLGAVVASSFAGWGEGVSVRSDKIFYCSAVGELSQVPEDNTGRMGSECSKGGSLYLTARRSNDSTDTASLITNRRRFL